MTKSTNLMEKAKNSQHQFWGKLLHPLKAAAAFQIFWVVVKSTMHLLSNLPFTPREV